MLVDLGSGINLIGRNTAVEFTQSAQGSGCKATTTNKAKPLYVHRVGSGAAACNQILAAHVAVKYETWKASGDNVRSEHR